MQDHAGPGSRSPRDQPSCERGTPVAKQQLENMKLRLINHQIFGILATFLGELLWARPLR